MDAQLLLVEDDASIRTSTELSLARAGFMVTAVADGRAALEQLERGSFDLVLLDVMLPGLDGLEVCRAIRRDSSIPIIMLTARTDLSDVIVGLELGADDYVTKPFQTAELVARIRAVLRRVAPQTPPSPTLRIDGLIIDPVGFTVHKDGVVVELTATEFRLLNQLASQPGRVFTREILLANVWDYDFLGDSRLVDVAVARLRAKVEDDPAHPTLIRTVRGVGYRLERRPAVP